MSPCILLLTLLLCIPAFPQGPSEVIAAGQARLHRLTDDPINDHDPTWSPDGRWIAFVSARETGQGRPTAEGVFSRLFEIAGPAAITEKQEALAADPQWMAALKELGASFDTATPDALLQYRLGLYQTPAGPGQILREVCAQGYWHTYGEVRNVTSICQDRQGHLWFGTVDHVTCYDGHQWTTFTTQDGLASNIVLSTLEDREGNLWFGTAGGVSRYDGKSWTAFATQDGLPAPWATAIFQDQQGHLWFGAFNGGVCCYDGQVFQVLDQRDGLAGNMVWGIHQDGGGRLWFTTENGVTWYRPSALEPPGVCIDAAIANRRYEDFADLILPSRAGLVAFEFHGTSLTARPGALVFRYRLEGGDAEWRTTRAGHVEYPDLPPGLYTFQVQAVDQRMQYSPLADVRFRVRDPQEERIEELEEQVRERTRELEEKNRALERASRFKSDFLARMSHDLRTPMNAIIGYTRILSRKLQGSIDERQYRNLQNIQLSADHLLALINDILDLSRVEAGRIDLKPEPVDLQQLVAQCAASVDSLLRPGVELKQELADLVPLHTDVDRLSRVLMNLLSNAVKFTEQGHITVSVRSVDGAVELAVADTGIGIPAEDLPHIFEEFRQVERQGRRPEGTGLGLAIARKSMELLGGTISVESELGRGTRFTLRLRDYEG